MCLLGTDWYMCGNRLVLMLGGYSVVWGRVCVVCGEWKPLIKYELCVYTCVCVCVCVHLHVHAYVCMFVCACMCV